MSAKTRKVTAVARLVTRSQLQSVVNQIGQQLAEAMAKVQDAQDARLAAIEARLLGLEGVTTPLTDLGRTLGRRLRLVQPTSEETLP